MNSKTTLTKGWKIMNMAKLGTVLTSKSGAPLAPNTVQTRMNKGFTRYTLCEI